MLTQTPGYWVACGLMALACCYPRRAQIYSIVITQQLQLLGLEGLARLLLRYQRHLFYWVVYRPLSKQARAEGLEVYPFEEALARFRACDGQHDG